MMYIYAVTGGFSHTQVTCKAVMQKKYNKNKKQEMRTLKIYLAGFAILIATITNAQTNYKTLMKDFQKISGSWQGSLTYLDYSTGKPYTMPADIDIVRISKTNKFAFFNYYPNETSANSIDTIFISSDGKYIENKLIKSRQKLPNADIEIITEETGKDGNDNKPATFRHTYTFGKNTYKKRKDVQFIGEKEWINRHEYSYRRKPSRIPH
ncbi:MAG TPA: hypothetical protein VLR49_00545 [Ferruginibacter sp.]|nr:hypothetical protein [Ferruginibacter sp.]